MDIIFEFLKVFILGIVEGITEWLPISSTGHMILVDEFIKLNVSDEFMNMFIVVIQLGAIMAVVLLYFKKLWPFQTKTNKGVIKKDTMSLWFKVIMATLPAAIIGIPFDDFIEENFNNYITVAITLISYGILFILIEKRNKGRRPMVRTLEELSYKEAVIIGIFQVLSLIPGTSRSGSTILGAILIGCSRYVATEFSFFLAIPVMFGASFLKLVKYFLKTGIGLTGYEVGLLIFGMLTAFFVSVWAIKSLLKYLKKNDFTVFGYYRIVLGILVIGYFVVVKMILGV